MDPAPTKRRGLFPSAGAKAPWAQPPVRVRRGWPEAEKNRREKLRETSTSPIMTGTSIKGPTTAAKACPDPRPNTETATAMASSKLLLAAVKERGAGWGYGSPSLRLGEKETRDSGTKEG